MLSHANLRYQLDNLHHYLAPRPGDRSLSLLPPWHIYERSCGYFLYSRACTQVTLCLCEKSSELLQFLVTFLRTHERWSAQGLLMPCRCTLTLENSKKTCLCTLHTTLYVSP